MHFACICNTVFRMFSCLQINCRPFYLRQLLKFHQFDWPIGIYLQTEGQGTHHKMVSVQPMSGFSPLFFDNSQFISTAVKPGLYRALVARLGTDVLSMEDKMVVYFNTYSHVNCRESSKLN